MTDREAWAAPHLRPLGNLLAQTRLDQRLVRFGSAGDLDWARALDSDWSTTERLVVEVVAALASSEGPLVSLRQVAACDDRRFDALMLAIREWRRNY